MPSPDDEAAASRAALAKSLQRMPQAMRERPQWVLWRYEQREGRAGTLKVPYYVSGEPRQGELGGPADLAALATFEAVLARFTSSTRYSGIGFAFVAGDGLVGIDLDWKDSPDGEMAEHHRAILEACNSFTERSPSGKGVHIIVAGQLDSFKHDPVGVEVYCGGRYFTCTGNHVEGTPLEVVQRAAEAAGLYFALDLGARGSCAIGGNLSTNAGGTQVLVPAEDVPRLRLALAREGLPAGGSHCRASPTGSHRHRGQRHRPHRHRIRRFCGPAGIPPDGRNPRPGVRLPRHRPFPGRQRGQAG